MKLLQMAVMLGLGEGLAALAPQYAPTWPLFAAFALLAFLFGYGLSLRSGVALSVLFLGAALYLRASVAREELLRESPWLRSARVRRVDSPVRTPARRALSARVGIGLSPRREAVALNRAILLGERRRLPRATRRAFVESGTIHVFAISGLHVMVVAKTLAVLLALCLVPLRWAGALALPLVWGYVALVGCPASAVRAALMASFYFAAPVFWRRSDALRAWAETFIALHLADPTQIADVGSLLSFTVVLALLVGGRLSARFANGTCRFLFMTAMAWAAGTPIAAHVFGRITPGGLVANMFLLPAAVYSVAAGTVGVLASFVSRPLAAYVNNLSSLFTDSMAAVARVVSDLPGMNFEIRPWSLAACVAWYGALVATLVICFLAHAKFTHQRDGYL